jgi:hypothetical protein
MPSSRRGQDTAKCLRLRRREYQQNGVISALTGVATVEVKSGGDQSRMVGEQSLEAKARGLRCIRGRKWA